VWTSRIQRPVTSDAGEKEIENVALAQLEDIFRHPHHQKLALVAQSSDPLAYRISPKMDLITMRSKLAKKKTK
jgi:hypothetical protein